MGVEPEGGFSAEGGTGGSEKLQDVGVGNETDFPVVGDSVDGGGTLLAAL